jgi:hypothetical protein
MQDGIAAQCNDANPFGEKAGGHGRLSRGAPHALFQFDHGGEKAPAFRQNPGERSAFASEQCAVL